MTRTILRRTAWVVLCTLLLIAAVIVFALNSEWALRTALPRVLAIVPADIEVAGIEGTVADGITLRAVTVDSAGTQVSLGGLALDIDTGALLGREVVIRSLTLNDVNVTPPPASDAPPSQKPFALPEIEAPLPIRIDALTINGLGVSTLPDYPVERIAAALALR